MIVLMMLVVLMYTMLVFAWLGHIASNWYCGDELTDKSWHVVTFWQMIKVLRANVDGFHKFTARIDRTAEIFGTDTYIAGGMIRVANELYYIVTPVNYLIVMLYIRHLCNKRCRSNVYPNNIHKIGDDIYWIVDKNLVSEHLCCAAVTDIAEYGYAVNFSGRRWIVPFSEVVDDPSNWKAPDFDSEFDFNCE